jgi:MFS family permease
MGGIVYGWPALSKMLTDENSRRGCGLTIGETTWLFTVASTTGMISTLLLGYLLDRWGPRLCSVCSHAAILLGSFYFAFGATKVVGFGIGISLVAFGGPGIIVSTVHLANLFPSHQFTAMSLLNGTIAFSMSVLALFAMLWDRYRTISYRHLFGAFGMVVGLSLIASILVWPDFSYTPPADYDDDNDNDENDAATVDFCRRRHVPGRDHQRRATNNVALKDNYYVAAATLHQHSVLTIEQPLSSFLRNNDGGHFPGLTRHNSYLLSKKALESGLPEAVSLKDAPFWTQFTSGYYVRANVFFVVLCFWANFYIGSLTMELADINTITVSEQYRLTRLFGLVLGGGVIPSFAIGSLMDRAGVEVATIWTIGLAMAHQLVIILGIMVGHYQQQQAPPQPAAWTTTMVGYILYVFYRSFLFPVSIVLITSRLGFKYFGLLNGFGPIVLGLLQLIMVPIVQLVQGTCHNYNSTEVALIADTCQHGKWVDLHIIEAIILGLLFLVPLFDHRANLHSQKWLKKLALLRSSWRILYNSVGDGTLMSPLISSGMGRSAAAAERSKDSYHSSCYGSVSANSLMNQQITAIRERVGEDATTDQDVDVLEF